MEKHLILIAMHGMGGAKGSKHSPAYPWKAGDLSTFIQEKVKSNIDMDQFYDGLFWKGVIEAGKYALDSGNYEDVLVICSKGSLSKKNKRYVEDTVRSYADRNRESIQALEIIPVGKSMGGIQSIEIIKELTKQKRREPNLTFSVPYYIAVDPDNALTHGPDAPLRIVPDCIEHVHVLLQHNLDDLYDAPFPRGLFGRKLARRRRSSFRKYHNIEQVLFPKETRFPADEPCEAFQNRELTHWTIDEYVMLYGWQGVTVQNLLQHYIETNSVQKLKGALVL